MTEYVAVGVLVLSMISLIGAVIFVVNELRK